MDFQKLLDAISDSNAMVRSSYHLTLDKAIDACEGLTGNVTFSHGGSPTEPHSYRGYYSDLSFETTNEVVSVERFLDGLKNCVGRIFEGYKGGDFTMKGSTPLWAASYGCTGLAIVEAKPLGNDLVLVTKDI